MLGHSRSFLQHSVMFSVIMNPLLAFELLFFAVFGQTTYDELTVKPPRGSSIPPYRPLWTDNLFKVAFGIYMLVSVVVLINLLIAMMSDTYQRIQVIVIICDSSPKEPRERFRATVFCGVRPDVDRPAQNTRL